MTTSYELFELLVTKFSGGEMCKCLKFIKVGEYRLWRCKNSKFEVCGSRKTSLSASWIVNPPVKFLG
jgi:hypothetical protein